eukprot:CAMPEP_0117550466 /NCGR_PEP_ID=MMETSP0784-20121206/48695_1 /TAXON_ID=39447 /ORGANISM="" /LENGTH=164 /DNA_ID=CAMNT_0005347485 /DNA_START=117 /DNA_END=611 /DNA_ORIENTATION=+
MQMSFGDKFAKAAGIAAMGFALAGPIAVPPQAANAEGASSASTVYRARNYYGAKIKDMKDDVNKGNFAAFEDKKAVSAFDLFISGSNRVKSPTSKARQAKETELESKFFAAVQSKNSGDLKAAYNEFIKVADLTEEYKSGEVGQTDSSGYSPTWGTSRQYIYQR